MPVGRGHSDRPVCQRHGVASTAPDMCSEGVGCQYSRGPRCVVPYLTSEAARGAFQRVLLGVRHPFVWPVAEAKFLEDRDRALVLCRFAARGSLRDVMHKVGGWMPLWTPRVQPFPFSKTCVKDSKSLKRKEHHLYQNRLQKVSEEI